jgi:hypothetical protein
MFLGFEGRAALRTDTTAPKRTGWMWRCAPTKRRLWASTAHRLDAALRADTTAPSAPLGKHRAPAGCGAARRLDGAFGASGRAPRTGWMRRCAPTRRRRRRLGQRAAPSALLFKRSKRAFGRRLRQVPRKRAHREAPSAPSTGTQHARGSGAAGCTAGPDGPRADLPDSRLRRRGPQASQMMGPAEPGKGHQGKKEASAHDLLCGRGNSKGKSVVDSSPFEDVPVESHATTDI